MQQPLRWSSVISDKTLVKLRTLLYSITKGKGLLFVSIVFVKKCGFWFE